MIEAAGMHDHIEVDTVFTEGMEAYDRRDLNIFVDLLDYGLGDFQRDALDFIGFFATSFEVQPRPQGRAGACF